MLSNNFFSDQHYQNRSQKGRSLIEIIAILIILAILLIAALIGFRALLDYLKKKETSQQILTIATRYKTDRLGKIRKDPTGKIRLKEFFPEGSPCQTNLSTCVKTPDGGQIELYSYEDTTSFVILASNVSVISCEEAILAGGFTKVKSLTESEKNTALNHGNLGFITSDIVFNSRTEEFADLEYFKNNPDKLQIFCTHGVAFIYTDYASGVDCKHFYDGKCHNCPRDEIEDRLGQCCDALKECGLCPP